MESVEAFQKSCLLLAGEVPSLFSCDDSETILIYKAFRNPQHLGAAGSVQLSFSDSYLQTIRGGKKVSWFCLVLTLFDGCTGFEILDPWMSTSEEEATSLEIINLERKALAFELCKSYSSLPLVSVKTALKEVSLEFSQCRAR